MLTQRQLLILKTIVEEFVKTAEPVGSKLLIDKYQLPFSSATIRNEMAYLEDYGLLEKTHTSSGRVPSAKGYRFYVDNLMDKKLEDEEKHELQQVFFDSHLEVEDIVKKSCDVISELTNLTSIVLGPSATVEKLQRVQLTPLSGNSAVVVLITDKGHVENKSFLFEEEVSLEDMQNCCNILNDRLVGTEINHLIEKLKEIEPVISNYVARHEALFKAFVNAFMKFASDNVYYSGRANMLNQPEFADVEKIRKLMRMLENGSIWRQLDCKERVDVQIAGENQIISMDDISIITTKYRVDEETSGTIAVIGPTRMQYNKVVSMLEFLNQSIENFYNKE